MNIDRALMLVTGLALAATLVGCTPVDRGFGDSSRTNLAVQVVDPDPVHTGAASVSGEKMGDAAERYRIGTVKQPVGIKTTTGLTGASGSGQ